MSLIKRIFGTKNKGKLICNSSNDIISGNFDSEKVDQDGIFYYKDILHFFEWSKYYTNQKSYLVSSFAFCSLNFKRWNFLKAFCDPFSLFEADRDNVMY
jgi:hypothetical protein